MYTWFAMPMQNRRTNESPNVDRPNTLLKNTSPMIVSTSSFWRM
jgi:hypothetical protein